MIPVNGFYERKRENKKLMGAVHNTPVNAMLFAGIYRTPEADTELFEVSIITTSASANESMSQVHDRMSVIFTSQNAAMAWIQENTREALDDLIKPASNDILKLAQVGVYVNKSTNEGAECIRRLDRIRCCQRRTIIGRP